MQGESRTSQPPDESFVGDRATPAEAEVALDENAAGESDAAAAEAQAEVSRLKDALLRTTADYDNFRKRTRREFEEARRNGREDLLRILLPVFDNLERAIQSAQRTSDVKAMTEGLTLVQRQFNEALGRDGIARVPTVGRPFDPSVHEAIQQVETSEHEAGMIIAEVQPGYTQGERLLRAAMVVVARPKTSQAPNGESSDGAGVN
jgi:molecular chaperone GrpE